MSFSSGVEATARALGPHGATLLGIARASILSGLREGRPARVRIEDYEPALREAAACFVTLHLDGGLRGCTGTVAARRALVEDVAENAFTSAFEDPRFAPLSVVEFSRLNTEISVLTAPERLAFADEDALLACLVPGEDGLLLEADGARGLFLPQVWKALPAPDAFLAHLKAKAGLPAAPLGGGVCAARFRVVEIAE